MNPDEPTCELRERIVSLTYHCPKGAYVQRCPFAMLQGLSDASRRSVLGDLSYAKLTELFDLAPQCVCPADPKGHAAAHVSALKNPRSGGAFA